jgi:protein gp37
MPDTSIEWTDAVWNPVVGCSRVSEGCRNCYAERFAHRGMSEQHRGLTVLSSRGPQWTGEVRFLEEKLGEPLRWKKPRRVFVNSMSDLFHPRVTNEEIAAVFGVMAAASKHTFQVLTKRPERMLEWFKWMDGFECDPHEPPASIVCEIEANNRGADADVGCDAGWPLRNVWLGVSAEDQRAADERIPLLIRTPAAVRFVSAEPLLGSIDFERVPFDWSGVRVPYAMTGELDWVIAGGETGPGARECDLGWVRSIVRQCRDAGVACFVKQLGAKPVGWQREAFVSASVVESWPEDLQVRQFPEVRDAD